MYKNKELTHVMIITCYNLSIFVSIWSLTQRPHNISPWFRNFYMHFYSVVFVQEFLRGRSQTWAESRRHCVHYDSSRYDKMPVSHLYQLCLTPEMKGLNANSFCFNALTFSLSWMAEANRDKIFQKIKLSNIHM